MSLPEVKTDIDEFQSAEVLPFVTGDADLGTLRDLNLNPVIKQGEPLVEGTGVRIKRIVGWHKKGKSPDEISENFPHISKDKIYSALSFYEKNKDYFDRLLEEEESIAPPDV